MNKCLRVGSQFFTLACFACAYVVLSLVRAKECLVISFSVWNSYQLSTLVNNVGLVVVEESVECFSFASSEDSIG